MARESKWKNRRSNRQWPFSFVWADDWINFCVKSFRNLNRFRPQFSRLHAPYLASTREKASHICFQSHFFHTYILVKTFFFQWAKKFRWKHRDARISHLLQTHDDRAPVFLIFHPGPAPHNFSLSSDLSYGKPWLPIQPKQTVVQAELSSDIFPPSHNMNSRYAVRTWSPRLRSSISADKHAHTHTSESTFRFPFM